MKKQILFEIFMSIILLSVLPCAHSAGFYSADITINAGDFNTISRIYPPEPDLEQDGCTWYSEDTAIYTLWDHGGEPNHYGRCLWVEYGAELPAGFWRIGLNAINIGAGIKSSEWYPKFEVLVEIEGASLGHLRSGIVRVPASDIEVNHGSLFLRIPEDGWYSIKYTWLNDKSEECEPAPCAYDANIMIDSVFFDKLWPR